MGGSRHPSLRVAYQKGCLRRCSRLQGSRHCCATAPCFHPLGYATRFADIVLTDPRAVSVQVNTFLRGSTVFFSFPFKGKAGMGMGVLGRPCKQPHPHPNPPLEGEGFVELGPLLQTGEGKKRMHLNQSRYRNAAKTV
jgi:hypothetical protein